MTQQVQGSKRMALSLLIVSVILGFMVAVQFSTSRKPHASIEDIVGLRSQLRQEQERQKNLEYQLSQAKEQLAQYQQAPGDTANMIRAIESELQNVRQEAGLEQSKGPGIIITISQDPVLARNVPDPHVYDFNLLALVNLLFTNGADAIAINGQRIVSLSSIREVGVMEVNTHPIMMPYVITVIGDTHAMTAALTVNHIAEAYRDETGMDFRVEEKNTPDMVVVPAYTNPVHFQYTTKEVGQSK